MLGNQQPIASLPGEIVAHGFSGADWYDYSAKYDEGGMELIVPPRISESAAERVQEVSVGRLRRHGVRGHGARRLLRHGRRATCSSTS